MKRLEKVNQSGLENEMFKLFFIGILAVFLSAVCFAQNETETVQTSPPTDSPRFVCLDSTQVTIQVLNEPLPTQSDSLKTFLWEKFIWGPEPERFQCRVWDSRVLSISFANSLVNKARAKSLDSASLRACLDHVLQDSGRNAYLPISAAYGDFGDKPAWVILVKWERAASSSREVLGHVRVYVMDAKDASLLGFATCS